MVLKRWLVSRKKLINDSLRVASLWHLSAALSRFWVGALELKFFIREINLIEAYNMPVISEYSLGNFIMIDPIGLEWNVVAAVIVLVVGLVPAHRRYHGLVEH